MATSTQLNRGGITGRGNHRAIATGDVGIATTTQGTDTTPVVTETYIARVFVPINATLTGVAILNGSAVAGNVTVGLADNTGTVIAQSASTAQAGTATLQSIPFASAVQVLGPGTYFVMVQFDSTSARFRSHALGVFPTTKQTSQTYGTLTSFTPPTTFTATVGPVASTY